jgi:hypothetical protein
MSQDGLPRSWLLILSLGVLACGIVFQSTTMVREDESNVSTLTIAIGCKSEIVSAI